MKSGLARVLLMLAGLALAIGLVAAAGPRPDGHQPIAFNHRLHTQDQGLTCVTCHLHVETGEQAGRPPTGVCIGCHETALTESTEEEKIRTFAAAGEQIPWVRLTWLPDHVYFSHRRHVAVAGIDCATCHGPMQVRTTPPARPLKTVSMSSCMDCHEKKGASLDCNACHR